MPFALVTIGLLMIVSAARDTHKQFGAELADDLTGSGSFIYWLVAIGVAGSFGYVDKLKPVSTAFMALILVSFILKNGGVFDKFMAAIEQGSVHTLATKAVNAPITVTDNSKDFVNSVSQSVQAGIAANAAKGNQAQQNFGKVVSVASKIFGF